jgi:hypothetical protein
MDDQLITGEAVFADEDISPTLVYPVLQVLGERFLDMTRHRIASLQAAHYQQVLVAGDTAHVFDIGEDEVEILFLIDHATSRSMLCLSRGSRCERFSIPQNT